VLLDGGVLVGDAFESISVGTAHACGIVGASSGAARDVECWGANLNGQAGLPSSSLVSRPNRLGLGAKGPLKNVASGGDVSCALFANGSLYCWGANERGQLGQGGAGPHSFLPLLVPLPTQAIDVSVGDLHVCALLSDRSVWCWGDDSVAQLGAGPGGPALSGTPTQVLRALGHPLKAVHDIAAGGKTTCVTLLGESEVSCWGANEQGQSGQPPASPVSYATPVAW
jgi:alpha-tubulin suppressor-like RCC1 family protein